MVRRLDVDDLHERACRKAGRAHRAIRHHDARTGIAIGARRLDVYGAVQQERPDLCRRQRRVGGFEQTRNRSGVRRRSRCAEER